LSLFLEKFSIENRRGTEALPRLKRGWLLKGKTSRKKDWSAFLQNRLRCCSRDGSEEKARGGNNEKRSYLAYEKGEKV